MVEVGVARAVDIGPCVEDAQAHRRVVTATATATTARRAPVQLAHHRARRLESERAQSAQRRPQRGVVTVEEVRRRLPAAPVRVRRRRLPPPPRHQLVEQRRVERGRRAPPQPMDGHGRRERRPERTAASAAPRCCLLLLAASATSDATTVVVAAAVVATVATAITNANAALGRPHATLQLHRAHAARAPLPPLLPPRVRRSPRKLSAVKGRVLQAGGHAATPPRRGRRRRIRLPPCHRDCRRERPHRRRIGRGELQRSHRRQQRRQPLWPLRQREPMRRHRPLRVQRNGGRIAFGTGRQTQRTTERVHRLRVRRGGLWLRGGPGWPARRRAKQPTTGGQRRVTAQLPCRRGAGRECRRDGERSGGARQGRRRGRAFGRQQLRS